MITACPWHFKACISFRSQSFITAAPSATTVSSSTRTARFINAGSLSTTRVKRSAILGEALDADHPNAVKWKEWTPLGKSCLPRVVSFCLHVSEVVHGIRCRCVRSKRKRTASIINNTRTAFLPRTWSWPSCSVKLSPKISSADPTLSECFSRDYK